MRTFNMLLVILCGIGGAIWALNAFSAAQSAIHEIEGLIGVLIVCVAASAGYIAGTIEDAKPKAPEPPAVLE